MFVRKGPKGKVRESVVVQKDDANKVQGNKTRYDIIMNFYWEIKKVFLMTFGKGGT